MGREYMISVLIYLIYLGLYEQKSIYLGEEMRKQARKPDKKKKKKLQVLLNCDNVLVVKGTQA